MYFRNMLVKFILLFSVISGNNGDSPINIKKAPYIAFIYKKINLIRAYVCSGTIITDNWILTVAHCLNEAKQGTDTQREEWMVRVGLTTVGKIDPDVNYDIKVEKYIQHPSWYPNKRINDIALLFLEKSIVFTEFVKPTQLALPVPEIQNQFKYTNFNSCSVIGWKRIVPHVDVSAYYFETKLHMYNVNVISIEDCADLLNACPNVSRILGDYKLDFNYQMCAFNYNLTSNPCIEYQDTGDSGAPLICNNVQYGLVSWPFSCSLNIPAIYTRLDMYTGWIVSIIKINKLVIRSSSQKIRILYTIFILIYSINF